MGSMDKAVVIGFMCRLCTSVTRLVIPIFSEEGERLQLVRMIQEYLSLPISQDDQFPKTVCVDCIQKLLEHYEMRMKWQLAERKLAAQKALKAQQMENSQNEATG